MSVPRLGAATLFALLAFAGCLLPTTAGAAPPKRTVIGRSVRGRPIVAIPRGERADPDRILVFGCIHGDERAGMRVTRTLLAHSGPRDAALWVVPTLNPDGVAADTRGNAHGVDLNRNFGYRWRSLSGLEYSGSHPFSEPESRTARRLIRRLRPDVTIWFHQPFDLVDRSGGASVLERRYAQLAGLPLIRLRRYPGSATSWQNHTFARSTAFVVELPALVDGALVRRAAGAVLRLADEYGSATVAGASPAGGWTADRKHVQALDGRTPAR